jgi:carboxypeptidase D
VTVFSLCHVADAILSSKLNIPLHGIAIGNGWIDGRRQYPSFLDYAVKHAILEENSDVSDFSVRHAVG